VAFFDFVNKKTHYLFFCAISCSFFSPQQACTTPIMVDFLILKHFSRSRGTFGEPLPHFKGAADTLPRRFGEL
jgi:hypothetical protein